MANSLIINGTDYTSDVSDLDKIKLEFGLNSTNTTTYTLSQRLNVKGDLLRLIQEVYYEDCKSRTDLEGVLYLDKCNGISIPVVIPRAGTKNCPYDGCSGSTLTLKSIPLEDKAYKYLESTFIHQNGFIEYKEMHPRVWYCNQPGFAHFALLILWFVLQPVINIICLILDILRVVRSILCPFGLFCLIPKIPSCGPLFEAVHNLVTGCGRYTVTYYIKDILTFHASKASLSFKSSIFNNPSSVYDSTVYWSQQLGNHGKRDVELFITEEPLDTIIDLLEKLKQTFHNCDYRIIGNTLVFERNSYFKNISNPIGDLSKEVELTGIEPCFSQLAEDQCAYGDYRYTQDAMDSQGNRLVGSGMPYAEIIEYNSPPSENQRGACRRTAPFGGARFMFDQITHRAKREGGAFNFDDNIDSFRAGRKFSSGFDLYVRVLSLGLSDTINKGEHRETDLILSGDSASAPKLLVLEPNTPPEDAKVIKKKIDRIDQDVFYMYNYPLYYQEDLLEQFGEKELTYRYSRLDNPRDKNNLIKMDDFATPLDYCERVNIILDSDGLVYLDTIYGRAYPSKFELDDENCTIKFSGIEVVCSN